MPSTGKTAPDKPETINNKPETCLAIRVAKKPIDDNEDDDHAETAAAEFFSAITGNQCPEEVIHKKVFADKKM